MPPHDPQHQRLRRRLLRLGLSTLGLSVRQAAPRLGVDPAHLHAVLAGRTPLSDGLAFRLQAVCGLPMLALEAAPVPPLAPEQHALLRAAVLIWGGSREREAGSGKRA